MAKKKCGIRDAFTGRGGQRAVIAELLCQQCNAAIPEVDVGEDLFAFLSARNDIARIQVKTAVARRAKRTPGYVARFGVPLKQVMQLDDPALHYVLAVRLEQHWVDFIVLPRIRLQELTNTEPAFGYANQASGDLELRLVFRAEEVLCGQTNLSALRNAWHTLPPLQKSSPAL
jgi:hypothetical protein